MYCVSVCTYRSTLISVSVKRAPLGRRLLLTEEVGVACGGGLGEILPADASLEL